MSNIFTALSLLCAGTRSMRIHKSARQTSIRMYNSCISKPQQERMAWLLLFPSSRSWMLNWNPYLQVVFMAWTTSFATRKVDSRSKNIQWFSLLSIATLCCCIYRRRRSPTEIPIRSEHHSPLETLKCISIWSMCVVTHARVMTTPVQRTANALIRSNFSNPSDDIRLSPPKIRRHHSRRANKFTVFISKFT